MIKKLILPLIITTGLAYGAENNIKSNPDLTMNNKVKYAAWNPPMGKKESGESCKDGNCAGNFNCFKKDGKVRKFFSSLRKKVKKQCEKL